MNTRLEEGEEDNVLVRVVFFCFSNYIGIRMRFVLLSIHNFTVVQIFHGLWFLHILFLVFSIQTREDDKTPRLTPTTLTLPFFHRYPL